MTRVIFQSGLNRQMITDKWANFRKAFADFSVDKVAKFGPRDLTRLVADQGIVRNRKKIEAIISDATELQKIRKEFGSFRTYLDGLDKSQNYALTVQELGKRFKHLGPSSARIFLYSVGENIRPHEE